jgi:hypothetical protein
MGRTFLFECPRCHYRAAVAGGADRGFHCFVQTIVCRDCAALHDVTTRLRVPKSQTPRLHGLWRKSLRHETAAENFRQSQTPWYDRLLFSVGPRTKWVVLQICCPRGRNHRIALWNAPGKCPRCGTFLERTLMPYRIWD